MLTSVIAWSLKHRVAVVVSAIVVAIVGILSLRILTIDAFPDSTPVQVQVNTDVPGLVATEVERLVTFPIELQMGGLPGLVEVRSISQFGLSQVTVTFEDSTDLYLVRQLIAQRLSSIEMPPGVPRPELGPIATGLGEVFHYVLSPDPKGPATDLMDIRTFHDWELRPELRTVPGIAEINTWGGLKKQYQVKLDPERLFKYDLTFQQVVEALQSNNLNAGGGYIDRKGDMLLVHGIAAVGFITLSGVSVLSSMVLVTALRGNLGRGLPHLQAVTNGAQDCLRTVVMTSVVASVGFIPMALSTSMGAEVQRPLATVVIGGVISSMLMTLFVVPVLFVFLFQRREAAIES